MARCRHNGDIPDFAKVCFVEFMASWKLLYTVYSKIQCHAFFWLICILTTFEIQVENL